VYTVYNSRFTNSIEGKEEEREGKEVFSDGGEGVG
jgi:hypothetical protein